MAQQEEALNHLISDLLDLGILTTDHFIYQKFHKLKNDSFQLLCVPELSDPAPSEQAPLLKIDFQAFHTTLCNIILYLDHLDTKQKATKINEKDFLDLFEKHRQKHPEQLKLNPLIQTINQCIREKYASNPELQTISNALRYTIVPHLISAQDESGINKSLDILNTFNQTLATNSHQPEKLIQALYCAINDNHRTEQSDPAVKLFAQAIHSRRKGRIFPKLRGPTQTARSLQIVLQKAALKSTRKPGP